MQRDPNSVCVCVCLIYDQTSDGHNSILKYRNKLRFKPLQANLKHTHVVYSRRKDDSTAKCSFMMHNKKHTDSAIRWSSNFPKT